MIGHLRHAPRRDEGRRLDAAQARIGQASNQLELDFGR